MTSKTADHHRSTPASTSFFKIQPPPRDLSYYQKCAMGGIISCGVMHTLLTPLDVVKCNIQVKPAKYQSVLKGTRLIAKEEGMAALYKGWAPTLAGYSLQGFWRFGLYELLKDTASESVGPDAARQYRGLIYVGSACAAEFVADCFMCPWEMIKVKMQTSPAGTFPLEFRPALRYMINNSAETRFPFGSLVPLWGRQIPYAIAKFCCFESIVEGVYSYALTKPRSSYSEQTQLGVTFFSGFTAGLICAVVSHPADSLISMMSKAKHEGKTPLTVLREVGFVRLMTKGLGSRLLMVGMLTSLQWGSYDTFKTYMGLGTSGGQFSKPKAHSETESNESHTSSAPALRH